MPPDFSDLIDHSIYSHVTLNPVNIQISCEYVTCIGVSFVCSDSLTELIIMQTNATNALKMSDGLLLQFPTSCKWYVVMRFLSMCKQDQLFAIAHETRMAALHS